MGRILKRVPLDFKWPINQIWKGYLNPYRSYECKSCGGEGYNPETKKISDEWYNMDNAEYRQNPYNPNSRYNINAHHYHITQNEINELVKEGRLSDLFDKWYRFDEEQNTWMSLDTSLPYDEREWVPCNQPKMPTPEEVIEWDLKSFMGHDAINRTICVKTRAEELGVFGYCEACNGEGEIWFSDEIKTLAENWESVDPPTGNGYQMWENTGNGSPMSPVFETFEELCEWCSKNASVFGSDNFISKEEWMETLDNGFYKSLSGSVII